MEGLGRLGEVKFNVPLCVSTLVREDSYLHR